MESDTYVYDEANYLFFRKSYNPDLEKKILATSRCMVVKFMNLH
ncbi:hypothetical protein SAMN05660845_1941 [Flavobacterium swingsii]|uniref:Uncharacterized protein n=1 Tax=Flavobacterium swingsii TaxID=498292 RepID=A0A1I0Z1K4_9FLAO|nr:hypothetical protein SAMN05660845_1941 [Flavobacterium swingsii]